MNSLEHVALLVLRAMTKHKPEDAVLGSVQAQDLMRLALPHILTCPACGAEAWVSVDCALCKIASRYYALAEGLR